MKALRKVGFQFNPHDYHPRHLEILYQIQMEFSILESKELEQKSKSLKSPRKR